MKMLYFLVTHLSLSTSLNKNFDWLDNRPFLKHHSSSSFMELTDVLSALCPFSALTSVFIILISRDVWEITTHTRGITRVGNHRHLG